jgi:hypothetical protein
MMSRRVCVLMLVLAVACTTQPPVVQSPPPAPVAVQAAAEAPEITKPLPISFTPEAVQVWRRPFTADALAPDTQWVTHLIDPPAAPSNIGGSIIRNGRVTEVVTAASFIPADKVAPGYHGTVGGATMLDDGTLALIAEWPEPDREKTGHGGVAFRAPDGEKSAVEFFEPCMGFVAPGPEGTVLVSAYIDNYELKPSPLLTVLDRDGVVRGEFFDIPGGQGPIRPCNAADRAVVRRVSKDLYGIYNAWTSEVVLFRLDVPKRDVPPAKGLVKAVRGSAAQDASIRIERTIPVGDWPEELPAPEMMQNLVTFAWDGTRLVVPYFARSSASAGVYFVEYVEGAKPRHIPVPGFWTNLFWWEDDLYGLQWQREPGGQSKIASVPVLTRIQL